MKLHVILAPGDDKNLLCIVPILVYVVPKLLHLKTEVACFIKPQLLLIKNVWLDLECMEFSYHTITVICLFVSRPFTVKFTAVHAPCQKNGHETSLKIIISLMLVVPKSNSVSPAIIVHVREPFCSVHGAPQRQLLLHPLLQYWTGLEVRLPDE